VTRQEYFIDFKSAIQDTIAALQSLSQLLEEEFSALSSTDPQDLEAVLTRKNEVLQLVEARLQTQEQAQASVGLPKGLPQIDDVLRHFGQENLEFRQVWEQLRELSRKVEQQNNRNGRLVHQNQQVTQEALAIITGRPQDQATYSQKGSPRTSLSSHSIAKA